jgi:hypothetical protein
MSSKNVDFRGKSLFESPATKKPAVNSPPAYTPDFLEGGVERNSLAWGSALQLFPLSNI